MPADAAEAAEAAAADAAYAAAAARKKALASMAVLVRMHYPKAPALSCRATGGEDES